MPVFALTAAWVHRRWPARLLAASIANLGLAAILAQLLEPLGEQVWYFHRFALGVEPQRWTVFLVFMAVGIAAYAAALAVLRARSSPVAPAL